MFAVLKRELGSYFQSITAYLTASFLVLISGFLFYVRVMFYAEQSSIMAGAPSGMGMKLNFNTAILASLPATVVFVLLFFVVPIMTMHLFAEEKKNGTLEVLFTYPLTEFDLIFGKYFSCLLAILPGIIISAIFPFFLHNKMPGMDMGYWLSGYIGVLLACTAGISIGIWASSVTDKQIIACALTILIIMGFWLIGAPASMLTGTEKEILQSLSFAVNMETFTKGVIELNSVLYFIGISVIFLNFTYFNLASRNWRG